MKNDPSKSPSPISPAPARHQFEHLTPTVIHDPEADMMLLAKWAHRAMLNPTRFWSVVGGGVAAILGLVVLGSVLSSKSGSAADVWTRLDAAKNADDQVKIAKEHPGTPAASWALLQAASRLYKTGIDDLPKDHDAALQSLKKAIDLFDEAGKGVAKDSPVALTAALGKARSLEARNELPKAIDQYKLVADSWPNSPEAAEAKELAAALQKPDAAAFYKELYSFTPSKVTLPPMGTESFDLPSGIGGFPGSADGLLGPATGIPSIPILPPPPPSPITKDADPAKTDAAKPEPAPAKAPETKPAPAPAETKPAPVPTPAPAEAKPAPAPTPAPAPAEAKKPGN
ncbi:tetratricopeptide repeat protein [Paludisphaera borealis]|uniref:Tetratricopeptide repeat-like domain-containing protein n=1 Tax=Paludisphaera borealis TaxID=1387353 RepID=A0A1U7CML8_9BACT|nr:tetratricopeptide repeat protein [Paludisphaera borealis]APW60185.1 hypothetical protein BSF38_01651 [Paludisphaera borealis]